MLRLRLRLLCMRVLTNNCSDKFLRIRLNKQTPVFQFIRVNDGNWERMTSLAGKCRQCPK